jgi:hypothetical protein
LHQLERRTNCPIHGLVSGWLCQTSGDGPVLLTRKIHHDTPLRGRRLLRSLDLHRVTPLGQP